MTFEVSWLAHSMALTPQDASRIAQLARLELSPTEAPEMLASWGVKAMGRGVLQRVSTVETPG